MELTLENGIALKIGNGEIKITVHGKTTCWCRNGWSLAIGHVLYHREIDSFSKLVLKSCLELDRELDRKKQEYEGIQCIGELFR